jgi:hypothetical protein
MQGGLLAIVWEKESKSVFGLILNLLPAKCLGRGEYIHGSIIGMLGLGSGSGSGSGSVSEA